MPGHLESYSSTPSHLDAISDGLDNYNILREIGRGSTSVVHLATCKRGRLRDRQVAIKMIQRITSDASTPPLSSSTSLHQALHHPAILSLFSVFSTPKADCHVLELCPRGTLSDYLYSCDPPTLSECELRGVLKNLTDALLYLRKECVIHRDIKTSNILLTDDYRVKLADFSLATRLPTVNSTTTTFFGSPDYASPEIVSRLPYSFGTDLWSLGCVMITCLAGNPPLKANDVSETFDKVFAASFSLPKTTSYEAKDLADGLLQADPAHRVPLHRIMSHPFFNPAFPIIALGPKIASSREPSVKPFAKQSSGSHNRLPPFPPKLPVSRNRPRHSDVPAPLVGKRQTLAEIGNLNLNGEVSPRIKIPAMTGSTRRIVSDPTPRLAGLLASEHVPLRSKSRSIFSSKESYTSEQDLLRKQTIFPCIDHSSPDTNVGTLRAHEIPPVRNISTGCVAGVVSLSSDVVPPKGTVSTVAIGTTRPLHFSADLLKAQMHKTIHGQVTILPSRSILVDFREGERRRGKKGDKVFVIDPGRTTSKVKIYNAPHLSAPCCLAEPVVVYSIEDLPSAYWEQYNDAGNLIEQIKQKTPKECQHIHLLVLYKSEVKCTLMANSPQANIELLFQSCPNRKHESTGSDGTEKPCMRIRLSRRNHSLEIARYVSGAHGGEWTKKVLAYTGDAMGVGEAECKNLDNAENDGMRCLLEFLQVSEAVEFLDGERFAREVRPSLPFVTSRSTPSTVSHLDVVSDGTQYPTRQPKIPSSTSSIVNALSTVSITRRPAKFGFATTIHTHGDGNSLPRLAIDTIGHSFQNEGISHIPQWCREGLPADEYSTIQTRFRPSVGWCIRYGSRVSQGGRYRILFLDGVVLDVDADEEWVEFKGPEGEVTRHEIRDCSKRKIGERMKVFKEFVSMFDDRSID